MCRRCWSSGRRRAFIDDQWFRVLEQGIAAIVDSLQKDGPDFRPAADEAEAATYLDETDIGFRLDEPRQRVMPLLQPITRSALRFKSLKRSIRTYGSGECPILFKVALLPNPCYNPIYLDD